MCILLCVCVCVCVCVVCSRVCTCVQLVVKPVAQNKGVEERNKRDIAAEERRNNPVASLHDKAGQVT